MRGGIVAALALLALPAWAGDFGKTFAKSGEALFAAGQWGPAMAAFDAACNEAPADQAFRARRRDAAARWIEATAPELARATPPEKALALLSALADEGTKRGADAAVRQHVAPALDATVLKLWTDEGGDDPKAMWQAIGRGEQYTQALPEGAAARAKLAALKQRAATRFAKQAAEAKQIGSAYLYDAMAARLAGQPPSAARKAALDDASAFNYDLHVAKPKACPALEPAFFEKLRQMSNYFSSRGSGPPVRVDVRADCVPLPPPRARQEARSWVERRFESNTVQSCSPQTNLVSAASHTEYTSYRSANSRTVTIVDVPAKYETVQNCSSKTYTREINEQKHDIVTILTEDLGFHVMGFGGIVVEGKAYVMPIEAKVTFERITTAGRIFGVKEDATLFDQKTLMGLTAHTVWLEMVYLNAQAQEGRAADLVQAASSGDADSSLGNMVNAVRVDRRITKDRARWFADRVGLTEQELSELVLDAPRVRSTLKLGTTYKLDVPKVDPNLAKTVDKKKKDSGAEDFR